MSIPITIPLGAVPAQSVSIQLGTQQCQIDVFQKGEWLFLDLYVADQPIVLGAICLNIVPIVRDKYHGFVGDIGFIDLQGDEDPNYTGLADRFQLIWAYDEEDAA